MHLLKHSVDGNGGVHVAVDLACTQASAGHDVVMASSGGRYDDLLTAHGVGVEIVPRAEGAVAATAQVAAGGGLGAGHVEVVHRTVERLQCVSPALPSGVVEEVERQLADLARGPVRWPV